MGSEFLFARPSWFSGIARVLDLWGVFEEFNDSATPEIADRRALWCDWRVTGHDLMDAMENWRTEDGAPEPTPLAEAR